MPTEFVYSRSGKFDFEIRWDAEEGRDPDIQIGICTHHHEQTLSEALLPEARAYGSTATDFAAEDDLKLLGTFRGVYGQFDRASINRMIRLLRKARDHVYGRDE